jgi:GNAT superfamily N-acetyltransferase
MENIIKELNLNIEAHRTGLRQRWDETQVMIIVLDATDIGWFQSFVKEDALFLAQLFVERALRGWGIGTAVVKALIEQALRVNRALTLGVVKQIQPCGSTSASGFASRTRMSASPICGATSQRTPQA